MNVQAGRQMRVAILVLMIAGLAGCTSMLLGNSTSSDMSTAAPDRDSAQVAQDDAISAAIRQQFSADTVISQYPIGIRTLDRKVTLSGTVGSYQVRDRAVQIASNTNNVAGVNNRMIVNTNL
jgi:osmotically-inducible protein OsmY